MHIFTKMKKIYFENAGREGLARVYGLCAIALGGVSLATAFLPKTREISPLVSELISSMSGIIGTGFVAEGIGDLGNAKHHYLSSKIYNQIAENRNRRWLY